jgi:hypothetical protein
VGSSVYQFELPLTLQPAQATYKIGDTIYLKSEFEDRILEKQSRLHLHLPNFRFGATIMIARIDTAPTNFNAARDFEYFKGANDYRAYRDTIKLPNSEVLFIPLEVSYDNKNSEYKFELKVVPQRAGTYMFTQLEIPQLTGFFSRKQKFSQQCKNTTNNFTYIINNDSTDFNFDYLRASPDTIWQRSLRNYFNQKNNYCFVVTP